MNQLEHRIRRELHAAGERIRDSVQPVVGARPNAEPRRPWRGPLAGIAAMATVMIVVGGVSLVVFRGPVDGDVASGPSDGLRPGTSVEGTVFDGSVGTCSTVTRGTLYLGGPAREDNLAADGFMLSLPAGPTPIDLATTFVSRAVIGDGCEQQITASTESDLGDGRSAVAVKVVPPASPVDLRLTVDTAFEDDVIGVIAVRGATSFDVVTSGSEPVLQLADALPPEAASVSVRFRKGEDVWELSVATNDRQIALVVPALETDRFPDAEPEWVLFTVRDRDGAVLDVGGALIP